MSHLDSLRRGADDDATCAQLPVRRTARRLPGVLVVALAGALAYAGPASAALPVARVPTATAPAGTAYALAIGRISAKALDKQLNEKQDKGENKSPKPNGNAPCCSSTGPSNPNGRTDPSGYGYENGH